MEEVKHELVIIRRRSAFAEEAHHGGVWKIAYADFMTAMMAFFLVMWLLNALNQDQKQVVASYFNPIKLAENAPAPKGLKDLSKKEPTQFEGQDGKRQPAGPNEERRGDSPTAEKPASFEEKVLFRDPYATLAEIANSANQASGQRRAGALTSAEEDGLKGGDAYRDPFDPGYWKLAPQTSKDADRFVDSEPKPNASARDNASGTGQGEPQAQRAKQDDAGGSVAPNADASSASLSPLLPPGPAPSQAQRDGSAQANAQPGAQASAAAQSRPNDTAKNSGIARCGTDPAADRQAATVRDRGCAVGHQGRCGPGGRGAPGRGRPSDQPDRRCELRHVRGRLGRAAARTHPRDRQDRAAADEAPRHDHRPRPHRQSAVQARRPTTIGGCPPLALKWPITCWCGPASMRSGSSMSKATPIGGRN